jgi:acyl-CoA thioester hydrolase
MGFQKEYFRQEADYPEPLLAVATSRVRFEEVDQLGIVWHGRYPSYFEDGRVAFGDRYGLSYHAFRKNLTVAPVVQMHVDYRHPLVFDDVISIEIRMHWTEAARINFSYDIFTSAGTLAATGYTVQLLTEPGGAVMFVVPRWLAEFKEKWRKNYWERP